MGSGVGGEGFGWSGLATVHSKQEWPDWYPPKEMLERRPDLQEAVKELQGGLGVPGGPENPLGARAMYLWQGTKLRTRCTGFTAPTSPGPSARTFPLAAFA
jgi:lipoprotein-anchoring transpeptidase ErfK/SrfK